MQETVHLSGGNRADTGPEPAGPTPVNQFGQPVGRSLPGWQPPPVPDGTLLQGRWCRLEPLDAEQHAAQLHAANTQAADGRAWTWLPVGPFDAASDYRQWVEAVQHRPDPFFYAVIAPDEAGEQAMGVAALMRIDPPNGVIEVGHINLSPPLQRTRAATEALTLLIGYGFSLGYRRFEWKCDSLNAPSRQAAVRLGFRFEGIFRQAIVTRGRNRDTAWFSIIDSEWPALAAAYARWLSPDNFDEQGRQRVSLRELTAALAPSG